MDETKSPYRTITAPVSIELVEKKSRFLTLLAPVERTDDVQALLSARRKEHFNATHHCTAYRLLDGTERSNDDGEPAGTAGRPMLNVLQQHGLVGVLAVVTRYFGGTLLGAGGLVRAYSGAVAEAAASAQIVTYCAHDQYEFPLSYADYERAQQILSSEPAWRIEPVFAEVVRVTLIAPAAERGRAQERITSLTRDAAAAQPIGTLWLPEKV